MVAHNGDGKGVCDGCQGPVDRSSSIASFSGFSDPGGRFLNTNDSVHYCLRSGFCLSDGYSCHSCLEQISHQESDTKSDSSSIGCISTWVHVFSSSKETASAQLLPQLLIWQSLLLKGTPSLS